MSAAAGWMDDMLHGLWSPGTGLLLWRGPDSELPDLPEPLARVLRRRFRRHHTVHVPATVGVEQQRVPVLALAPAEAADVLLAVPDDASGVSGDLRYLAHVARGVERWARAGRVVPELYRTEGHWWPRWRLLGGERQHAWLAELASAMPPVQRFEGTPREILDDFVGELTDAVVRELLGDRDAEHPLLRALLRGEPYDGGNHKMATGLDAWRESLTVDEPELVLRLLEPEPAEGDESDLADDALWRLQVCLRAEGEAPAPVRLHRTESRLLEIAVRKLAAAVTAYPRLRDLPTDPDSLDLLLPTAVVTDLVLHGARALEHAGIPLLLPRAWAAASPSLRVKVSSPPVPAAAEDRAVGMNEIVGYDWELALGDMVLTPDELTRLAETQSDLVRLRGQWVQADATVLAQAARYVTQRNSGEDGTLGGLLGQLTEAERPPVPVEELHATGWVGTLLDGTLEPVQVPKPAGLNAELRHYQQRGLDWLAFMSETGLGAVLADDMGLGKTLQLLALLAHERSDNPTLLVCPMSVVGNWQREAARFVPDLRVHVHHGADRRRGEDLAAAVRSSDLFITTYSLLARDVAGLGEQSWRRVVLDEAQHIKNSATAQARAARAIPAEHRIALTGTPVENRLDELRSILDFVNRGMLGSPQAFRARFAVPIEREQDEAAVTRLRAVTSPFILRRVKTDPAVISDLPEKQEMTVRANLTVEQAALYRAVVDDMLKKIKDTEGMQRKGAVLSALTRLKQVCNHPAHFLGDGSGVLRRGRHRSGKLALVEDILDSVTADGERALLFTQFREFGDLVVPYLEERFGTDVPFLHGGVPKARRDRMVERFQGDDGPPVMLLSLKAGGTGLNLTAANHVVHLDRWWNPAVENQATDRAFRIGQRRDVQVRKLVCVGTLEERIDAMISNKQELADLAIGTGEKWITEMSADQLHDLLILGDEAVGE
ncbi:ATP-dependent helicase [Rhodococcus hoagii]|uniref:ATP-dependent helicase n=1 Tax=Rhodococcus hoagii TaxID=43767 RepID=A0AAE4ZCH2_RHOHA|nr:DEAD/DEAH box helicase [Prescottella equi]MBM4536159.1 ATP-dependent helicase [Prescottella equi]NKR69979.1 ATP-dependent helicase [Prescottella equi]NKR81244.1 ATP-dependent helicase [Prescottella equi]NKS01243.1 ATP-dependent helicase [Prescottella equi]NKS24642.1 ATP-dependent helicase [Prescottella equi]